MTWSPSHFLAFMHKASISKTAINAGTLPEEYTFSGGGDLLVIDIVRLEPDFREYGIGLLALNGLLKYLPSFSEGRIIS